MSRTISLVQRVHIASPCPVSWESMAGDERVRFCSECSLHVYNLSTVPEREAERIIIEHEGKLCAAIYRRADGTILTQDCPRGLAAARYHVARLVAGAAAVVLFTAATIASALGQDRHRDRPDITTFKRTTDSIYRWIAPTPAVTPGAIAVPGGVRMMSPQQAQQNADAAKIRLDEIRRTNPAGYEQLTTPAGILGAKDSGIFRLAQPSPGEAEER